MAANLYKVLYYIITKNVEPINRQMFQLLINQQKSDCLTSNHAGYTKHNNYYKLIMEIIHIINLC